MSPRDAITLPTETTPLLVGATEAARLCSVSEATWWRLAAAGKVPVPIKLGGRTLWRVGELREWTAAGCPDRHAWDVLRGPGRAQNGRLRAG